MLKQITNYLVLYYCKITPFNRSLQIKIITQHVKIVSPVLTNVFTYRIYVETSTKVSRKQIILFIFHVLGNSQVKLFGVILFWGLIFLGIWIFQLCHSASNLFNEIRVLEIHWKLTNNTNFAVYLLTI